jgi:P27 family predicted phage terminase small subunit
MASPYPKPIEQKLREGNPGKRALPQPFLVAGRPRRLELDEPPEHLPADARDFWAEIVPHLTACGIVDRVDVPVLEMLSTAYARWRAAQRVIEERGFFARGSTGQVKEAPWVKIEREAHALFLKTAEQVGIGPLGRTRLGLAEVTRRVLADELRDGLGEVTLRPAGRVGVVVDGTISDG